MAGHPLIRDNAFRRLGVLATATTDEVRDRFEEAKVRAELGIGPEAQSVEELTAAWRVIQDPRHRLQHETYWIHSLGDKGAEADLQDLVGLAALVGDAIFPEQFRDVGVPEHAEAVVAIHRFDIEGSAMRLAEAVDSWSGVVANESFWSYLKDRANSAQGAGIRAVDVTEIRNDVPRVLAETVAPILGEAVLSGDDDRAREFLGVLSSTAIGCEVAEQAVGPAIAPLAARVRSMLVKISESLTANDWANSVSVALQECLPLCIRIGELDTSRSQEPLLDEVARTFAATGVKLANECDDYERACWLVDGSVLLACSQHVVSEVVESRSVGIFLRHIEAGDRALEQGMYVQAAAQAELAAACSADAEGHRIAYTLALNAYGGIDSDSPGPDVSRATREIADDLQVRRDSFAPSLAIAPRIEPVHASKLRFVPQAPSSRPAYAPTAPPPAGSWWSRIGWGAYVAVLGVIGISVVVILFSGGSDDNAASSSQAVSQSSPPSSVSTGSGPDTSKPPKPKPKPKPDPPTTSSVSGSGGATYSCSISADLQARLLKDKLNDATKKLESFLDDHPESTLPSDLYAEWESLRDSYKAALDAYNGFLEKRCDKV